MLVVGGTDAERLAAGPVQYTPSIEPNSYVVSMEAVTVGDESLPMPEKAVALPDTGTTLAFFPKTVFDAFQKVRYDPPSMHSLSVCSVQAAGSIDWWTNGSSSALYIPNTRA